MATEKNIKTPDILYKHFEDYKIDCKKNPRKENFFSHKTDKQISISREKPFTWDGFEIWLRTKKIIVRLADYKADKDSRYSKYAYIIHAIGMEIYEDKMTGAITGIYQHNIIARDLGLRDNKDITTDGEKITKLDFTVDSSDTFKALQKLRGDNKTD